jgi:hypothetical protein
LWLSPNGERVAVRRGDGTVEVYSTDIDADTASAIIGSVVTDCLGGAVELTDQYLVTSCDRFDANRGKVQVYQLVSQDNSDNSGTWELVVEIEGDTAGDRFGWRTTLDETPATTSNDGSDDYLFRLAVSAPNHDDKTGLVRTYMVNPNGNVQQFGLDLTGQEAGEQFGFAIAMSRGPSPNPPFLAVGVPQAAAGGEARGAIRIYNYIKSDGAADEWYLSAEFAGPEDRDRLGRDVAIAADGNRAAASTFRSAQFAGLVVVYERVDSTTFEEVSSDLFGQEALDRFGNNVALSETGSILASGSIKRQNDAKESVGSVRVFVDKSPFCSAPLETSQVADLETFLERQTCRSASSSLVITEEACSALSNFIGGQNVPCEWRESASVVAPTPSPTRTTAAPSAQAVEPEVPLPWSLEGCPCDAIGNCIEEPFAGGIDLAICIRGSRDDVSLVTVENFRLEQGSNRVVIIDETGLLPASSTSVSCTDGLCVIRTPVDATFFSTGRPDSLVAAGTIAVDFSRARSLRGEARQLQYVTGDFTVNVALSRDGDDENNGNESKKKEDGKLGLSSPLWITMVFLVALVIGCCCCITAKRQGEKSSGHSNGKSREQESYKEDDELSFA